jgi:hypothetical protein
MKKLWVASLLASMALSPQVLAATTNTQKEIEALKKRIEALEETADIDETRNYMIGTGMQFGVGSGTYADELYLIDFGLNRDLSLLHERQFINNKYKRFENAPHLLLSGNISGTVGANSNLFGIYDNGHEQFMKGSAEIDMTGFINEDWLGYLEIEADAFGSDTDLGVKQAFATYGNFDRSPMYLTLGYQYVPFGNFTTNFIESTVVQEMGRIQVPAANGAFNILTGNNWEINGGVFWFDGSTKTSDEYRLDEIGANLQARVTKLGPDNDISIMMGASVVNNLSSSNGMKGVIAEDLDSTVQDYVPAADFRAKVVKGPFSITAEYLGTMREFAASDIATGKEGDTVLDGAQPSSMYVEAAYDYTFWGMPNTLSARYGETSQSLAFGLPTEEYGLSYQLAPFFNTRVTFEYMHKLDYSESTVADVGGVVTNGTGLTDDLFQAQINVYF